MNEETIREVQALLEQRKRDSAKAYERKCAQQRMEWQEQLAAAAKERTRKIIPGLTGDQFDELADIFRDYFEDY